MLLYSQFENHNIFKLTNYKEAYQKADIVAFLVAHDEFKKLPENKTKMIMDFCGIIQ